MRDPALTPAAAATFTNDILPRVRTAPGFLAGYWVEPVHGRGFGFVLIENDAQARAIAPPEFPWSAPGATITDATIQRVVVAIPG